MQKFLRKIILIGLLFIAWVLFLLLLPATPASKLTALSAKPIKDSLLKYTKSPRIIFIGGSNLSFGLNSQIIKDSLHLNPVNTAIQAAIGLKFMMDNALKLIQKDDIVVLSPEYKQFFDGFAFGETGEALIRVINFKESQNLTALQYKYIIPKIPKYAFSKLNLQQYINLKEPEIFGLHTFNQFGDAYTHWNKEPQQFEAYKELGKKYNPTILTEILDFEKKLKQIGAKLFITFPCLQYQSFLNNKYEIVKIEKEISATSLKILGNPLRYTFPDSVMYNTPYHLIKKGVDLRTNLLIEDLKIVLK
jgi:5'(3')-deoxyribonucleotidase